MSDNSKINHQKHLSKKMKKIFKNVCFKRIITIFAFPNLRRSSPNQLILKNLGTQENN